MEPDYKKYLEALNNTNFDQLSGLTLDMQSVYKNYSEMVSDLANSTWSDKVSAVLIQKLNFSTNAMQALRNEVGNVLVLIIDKSKELEVLLGEILTAETNILNLQKDVTSAKNSKEAFYNSLKTETEGTQAYTSINEEYAVAQNKYNSKNSELSRQQSALTALQDDANKLISLIQGIEFTANIEGMLSGKATFSEEEAEITNAKNLHLFDEFTTPTDFFDSPILQTYPGVYVVFQDNPIWQKLGFGLSRKMETSCGAFALINLVLNNKNLSGLSLFAYEGINSYFSGFGGYESANFNENFQGAVIGSNPNNAFTAAIYSNNVGGTGATTVFLNFLNGPVLEHLKQTDFGTYAGKGFGFVSKPAPEAKVALLQGSPVRFGTKEKFGVSSESGHYLDYTEFRDINTDQQIIVDADNELAYSNGAKIMGDNGEPITGVDLSPYSGKYETVDEANLDGECPSITREADDYLASHAVVRGVDSYSADTKVLGNNDGLETQVDFASTNSRSTTEVSYGYREAEYSIFNQGGTGNYSFLILQNESGN
jgi:hypothetical protein